MQADEDLVTTVNAIDMYKDLLKKIPTEIKMQIRLVHVYRIMKILSND